MLNTQTINTGNGIESSGFITCHDWPIYRGLSQTQHGACEISTRVQISIQPEPARTREVRASPTSENTATRAELARVVGFDLLKSDAHSLGFILDKDLELIKTPVANPTIHPFTPIGFADSCEVFHDYHRWSTFDNSFADVVVRPSHKPLLFATQLLKKSFGRACAFSLKLPTQVLELPFDTFGLTTPMECTIGADSQIVYSEVDAQNTMRVNAWSIDLFGKTEQEKESALLIKSEQALTYFPSEVFFVAFGDTKRQFNSAIECADTQDVILETSRSWEIVSHTSLFDAWFGLSLLDNPTTLFDARNSKLSWQTNTLKPLVNKRLELDVILDLPRPCFINTQLKPTLIDIDCLDDLGVDWQFDLSSCIDSHTTYQHEEVYKAVGQFLPQLKQWASLPRRS